MAFDFPDVSYADADGVSIAYSLRGAGSIDIVRVGGVLGGILAACLDPVVAAHYEHLAGFARLIVLDRRGLGMSDPLVAGGAPHLEQQVEDVLAVMDAAGSARAALFGSADGGGVSILCAAMHPDRVSALVLNNTWARFLPSADYPIGPDRLPDDPSRWGDRDNPWGIEVLSPSRADEPGFRRLLAQVQQVSASRAAAAASIANARHFDVRSVLDLVQAPTLVLANDGNTLGHMEYLADHIPDARLLRYPGTDGYFGVHTPEIGSLIEEFLTGVRPPEVSDRVLATVLFTDIVGSTEQLATVGDHEWRRRLDQHDAMVRAQLHRFRGREISTAGDAFFATFDGPARAVRCAHAVIQNAHELGVAVRTGVHVGECEVRGDDLAGIAVHIGARVCALANAGEVLVTTTVRDLVAGSGLVFTDRGTHVLKGVPGQWPLLAADT